VFAPTFESLHSTRHYIQSQHNIFSWLGFFLLHQTTADCIATVGMSNYSVMCVSASYF